MVSNIIFKLCFCGVRSRKYFIKITQFFLIFLRNGLQTNIQKVVRQFLGSIEEIVIFLAEITYS